jgi:superfamily I DNA/RNA helicase
MARLARAAHELAGRFEAAAAGERLVAETLVTLTGRGWRLLVDRRWPGTRAGNVDMILVGPGGVFVIDVKNWRSAPAVVDGRLCAADVDRHDEVAKLLAQARVAEDAVTALGLAPVAVHPVLAFCGHRVDGRLGRVMLLGQLDIARSLVGLPRRLTAAQIRAVADHLETVFPAYIPTIVSETTGQSATESQAMATEAASLFDVEEIADATLRSALAAPIEGWMTFLHPDQAAQVRRRFGGPARISGPAGTGKTVVGLHRAVYLAQHSPHRVLYVTFANNLPRIGRSLVERFAPAAVDRIEFTSLHNLANTLLTEAEIPVRLHGSLAQSLLSKAWFTVGRRSVLPDLEPNANYWIDEVEYVIKGRGLRDLDQYLATERRGRRTMLRAEHRKAVWAVYEEYERLRTAAGIHDFNDVLSLAGSAVADKRVARRYSAVVVDECQDLTLVGMRLLHSLVGDAADGLLVIGDGQQAVYPGGYRLSEAGITIAGARGVVLRTNYRNAEAIWDAAMAVVAGDTFEDVDETRAAGRRDVETTYRDGTVVRVDAADQAEHDQHLLNALRALMTAGESGNAGPAGPLADAAVLCARRKDVEHYQRVLTKGGIPLQRLEHYDGQHDAACKIGTFHRVKGLEFKHVFLPCHDGPLRDDNGFASAAPERAELIRRQLFVAMTRARDTLWLGSVQAPGSIKPTA